MITLPLTETTRKSMEVDAHSVNNVLPTDFLKNLSDYDLLCFLHPLDLEFYSKEEETKRRRQERKMRG